MRSIARRVALVAAAALLAAPAAAGANSPGDPDPSFGSNGKVTLDLGPDDIAAAVATQPDGKIVVAGRDGVGLPDFAVARYNPDGSLDTSFDGDGVQRIPLGHNDLALAVAIDPDGKIVVVGQTDFLGTVANRNNFAIGRLTSEGAIDKTFDGDGIKTIDFGSDDQATAVVLQGDRIIVGGRGADGVFSNFVLVGLTSTGGFDPGFSGDGVQKVDFGGFDPLEGLALADGGRLLAVGSTNVGGGSANQSNFAMAQLNPDGSLDAGFSGDGKQTADLGADDHAEAVAYQSDGRAIVAGSSDGGLADFAAIRVNEQGTIDPSFAGDGAQTISFGVAPFDGRDFAESVAVTPQDEVVLGGFTNAGATPDDFAVAVLDPNGSPDSGFSGDGKQTVDVGGFDRAFGVAVANGRAYLAGTTTVLPNRDIAIASVALTGGGSTHSAPAAGDTAASPALSTALASSQPAADRIAPALSGLKLTPKRFKARSGTKVTYTLSEKAKVTLTVKRARRRNGRAVFVRFGRVTRAGVAGGNKFNLKRKIGARRLTPGRYRVTLVATDAAPNRSNTQRAKFMVKR